LDYGKKKGLAFGMVPDGVASVTAEFANAPAKVVTVKDNYFEIPIKGGELGKEPNPLKPVPLSDGISRLTWQDAEGDPVNQRPDHSHGKPGTRLELTVKFGSNSGGLK
jgi:hypothetical protein